MTPGLKSLVDKLPYDEDKIIGIAVSYFLTEQEPDSIKFTTYNNGYEITVKADKSKVDEMKSYWNENIEHRIKGE